MGKQYTELGILLEARSVQTGRSARNHLLALGQTNGVSRRRELQYPRSHETPRRMRDVDVRTLARPLPSSLPVTA